MYDGKPTSVPKAVTKFLKQDRKREQVDVTSISQTQKNPFQAVLDITWLIEALEA